MMYMGNVGELNMFSAQPDRIKTTGQKKRRKTMKKKYRVTGMGCAACVAHVQNAVQALSGVDRCEVDLETEMMTVQFDENSTGFEAMKLAVEDAGYGLEKE